MKKLLLTLRNQICAVSIIGLIMICISGSVNATDSRISFTVSMDDAVNHNLMVSMEMKGINKEYTVLKMPVWTPGYYKIIDYPRNLSSFTATDEKGRALQVEKTSKNIWKVNTRNVSVLNVSYVIYANSHSVADPYIDTTHAYIPPAGLFIYPEGGIKMSSEITFKPYSGWKNVSTGLDKVEGKENTWYASDFDVLFDSPVLLGNQDVIRFYVKDIPHDIAVLIPGKYNRDSLAADYKKMVESAIGIIGDIPYRHYTFIFMGKGGGGLEHMNSQADFMGFRGGNIYPKDRREFLGWMSFIAHEYFHLYNVKAIRPIALGPFNYDKENYTNMLWVSEGFTVYYEDIILNRAGFESPDEMLASLSRSISAYESIPGSKIQTVAMSSFDAWIDFFNFSENADKTTISYYDKGCGLALLLDLKIRQVTDNKKSLTDVMRTLYYKYYKGMGRGFTDSEFRHECEQAAGCSLEEIFNYAVTTVTPDYDKYLDYAGLFLERETSNEGKDTYVIKRKADPTEKQKMLFNDMFRPIGVQQ